MTKFVVWYLSMCDGGDEPSWQYMAMGSYDKSICPDSWYSHVNTKWTELSSNFVRSNFVFIFERCGHLSPLQGRSTFHSLLTELLVAMWNPTGCTSSSSCIVHLNQEQCSNNEEFSTDGKSLLKAIPYLSPEQPVGIMVFWHKHMLALDFPKSLIEHILT